MQAAADYLPPLARKIREARLAAGLSRAELASNIGATEKAIDFWEDGNRTPRMKNLRRVAQATGRPIAWFFLEEAA